MHHQSPGVPQHFTNTAPYHGSKNAPCSIVDSLPGICDQCQTEEHEEDDIWSKRGRVAVKGLFDGAAGTDLCAGRARL